MNGLIHSSLYFGMLVSVGAYMLGVWLKKKTGWAILNPLLVAIIVVIAFLSVFHIEYKEYNRGAVYLSYFLTPATVCLAIPLYKQLELLRQHLIAVVSAIVAGVAGSVGSIYAVSYTHLDCSFFYLCFAQEHYIQKMWRKWENSSWIRCRLCLYRQVWACLTACRRRSPSWCR